LGCQHEPQPTIEWASITPDHGTTETVILIQVAVSHTYGLDYIAGVIYSVSGPAGGETEWGQVSAAFIVSDLFGYSEQVDLIYRYDTVSGEEAAGKSAWGIHGRLFH